MITPTEAAHLREFIANLDACATHAAVNTCAHIAGQLWRPSDAMADAMAQIAAQHRKRLSGEIDERTCEMQVERVIMAGTGDVADMFGSAG